jgi:hypothetical protein
VPSPAEEQERFRPCARGVMPLVSCALLEAGVQEVGSSVVIGILLCCSRIGVVYGAILCWQG